MSFLMVGELYGFSFGVSYTLLCATITTLYVVYWVAVLVCDMRYIYLYTVSQSNFLVYYSIYYVCAYRVFVYVFF